VPGFIMVCITNIFYMHNTDIPILMPGKDDRKR
jgi:hypothetical protein